VPVVPINHGVTVVVPHQADKHERGLWGKRRRGRRADHAPIDEATVLRLRAMVPIRSPDWPPAAHV